MNNKTEENYHIFYSKKEYDEYIKEYLDKLSKVKFNKKKMKSILTGYFKE